MRGAQRVERHAIVAGFAFEDQAICRGAADRLGVDAMCLGAREEAQQRRPVELLPEPQAD